MQRKNGYYVFKSSRNDVRIVQKEDTYVVNPETDEGVGFRSAGDGTATVTLPLALCGRRYKFETSGETDSGNNRLIVEVASGSSDKIRGYDSQGAAGNVDSMISPDAAYVHQLILVCHEDGVWYIENAIGSWQEPNAG